MTAATDVADVARGISVTLCDPAVSGWTFNAVGLLDVIVLQKNTKGLAAVRFFPDFVFDHYNARGSGNVSHQRRV